MAPTDHTARRSAPIWGALLCTLLCVFPRLTSAQTEEGSPLFDERQLYDRLTTYERKSYEGLRCIMNDHQIRQYLSLPTRNERAAWLRKFWLLLDPTPATGINERKTEHEERVRGARKRYPAEEFPFYDGRGETLIRFGEPDWITKVEGQLVDAELPHQDFRAKMPGEVWRYNALNMVVPFEMIGVGGDCTYYAEIKTISRDMRENFARKHINIYGSELFFSMQEWLDYSPSNLDELYFAATDELLAFYSHVEHNRSFYRCDLARRPLQCYFDLTSFRGDRDRTRAEINMEIPLRQLSCLETLDRSRLRLQVMITAYDFDMNETARATDIIKLELHDSLLVDHASMIPAQYILSLKPGFYRFGLEVKDLLSGKHGCYRASHGVVPFGDTLSMSDVQFANSIEPAAGRTAFIKGPLRVVPHPLHAYRKPTTIKFYFEIYGLDTDSERFCFYSIQYAIEPKQKRRWGPVLKRTPALISSKFDRTASGATQREYIEIDTAELWEGSYRLMVKVTDRRTLKSVERLSNFSILDKS